MYIVLCRCIHTMSTLDFFLSVLPDNACLQSSRAHYIFLWISIWPLLTTFLHWLITKHIKPFTYWSCLCFAILHTVNASKHQNRYIHVYILKKHVHLCSTVAKCFSFTCTFDLFTGFFCYTAWLPYLVPHTCIAHECIRSISDLFLCFRTCTCTYLVHHCHHPRSCCLLTCWLYMWQQ